ncbi:hypothetical protein [Streptomyces sp. NPDC051567]|uniref:hypothetical protein n=1 Tax=Streptomyces sp. NPDC051567 TaxID=3365660 RepID=UPI0037BDA095
MTTTLTPRAGTIDDIESGDDARGYERDETDNFHRLVRRLVADGDQRAATAGRRARLIRALTSWACPSCGCLNGDSDISCGYC